MISEDFLAAIEKEEMPPHLYSPLNLAYVGDAVYTLLVRTRLVTEANRPTAALNKAEGKLVNAPTQSALYRLLMPRLLPEEVVIIRRGRNANPGQKAKNATFADYRNATGLEALFGYLYLDNQTARLLELFDICWSESYGKTK